LSRTSSPFDAIPKGVSVRGVKWVEPRLVAEVRFAEWTDEGILRQPAFEGLREDKPAAAVVRETVIPSGKASALRSSSSPAKGRGAMVGAIALSSPGRILYPEESITKQQLAEYYEAIADWILPYVVERPLTLLRCPQGRSGQCFIQRHWNATLPKEVEGADVHDSKTDEPYLVIRNLKGLVSLVQVNTLEIHPWGARVDRIERPDMLVIDLDPGPGVAWDAVKQSAEEVREELQGAGLMSWLRSFAATRGMTSVSLHGRSRWEWWPGLRRSTSPTCARTCGMVASSSIMSATAARRLPLPTIPRERGRGPQSPLRSPGGN
jgi:bifunctional non-homologous end joining protein LigD